MSERHLDLTAGTIAYDDSGGDGQLVLMIPGAGDVRSEYRFVAPPLVDAGFRVVTMDLRGHGAASADWPSYGMTETAADMVALLERLDAGPATVVATSFAPTAALWVAAERPDLVDRLVLISAHLDAPPAWQAAPLKLLMRGPIAAPLWASQFRGWHPGSPPIDLDEHVSSLRTMLQDPQRRRAVRDTLVAHRDGLAAQLQNVEAPSLVVMGGADSHFGDPKAEGESIARRTNGTLLMVPEAGHYPHVEYPEVVSGAIVDFLAGAAL